MTYYCPFLIHIDGPMKFSIYNSRIELSSKNIMYYNALTDKFLLATEQQDELISDCSTDPQKLYSENETLYNCLLSNGFIIHDKENEPAKVDELIRDNDKDTTLYQLHINPTMDCICRCWYCYEEHEQYSRMSGDMVKRIQRYVDSIVVSYPELERFYLSFFGGGNHLCISIHVPDP